MDGPALIEAVDSEFAFTSRGLSGWANPFPEGDIPPDAYSRVTEPGRYKLFGARADAWRDAVVGLGLATVEQNASVKWVPDGSDEPARLDRLLPYVSGGLPLAFGHYHTMSHLTILRIGVGDPAVEMVEIPHCGCDACDEGSDAGLERIDEVLISVVTGAFRRVDDGERSIVTLGRGWKASGSFPRDAAPLEYMKQIQGILDDPPPPWRLQTGPSWMF